MTATVVLEEAHARMISTFGHAVTIRDEYGLHVYVWSAAVEAARDRNPVGLTETRPDRGRHVPTAGRRGGWWDGHGSESLAGPRWARRGIPR